MDTEVILKFLYEFAFTLSIFITGLGWAFFVGRQSLINILISSYIALVFFSDFPFNDFLLSISESPMVNSILPIILFSVFVLLLHFIIKRLMPLEFLDGKFENLGKKLVLALGVTIFYSGLSFNIVPIHEILSLDASVQSLFTTGNAFYYSLIIPLGALAFQ